MQPHRRQRDEQHEQTASLRKRFDAAQNGAEDDDAQEATAPARGWSIHLPDLFELRHTATGWRKEGSVEYNLDNLYG